MERPKHFVLPSPRKAVSAPEEASTFARVLSEIRGSDPADWQVGASLGEPPTYKTKTLWLSIRLRVADGNLELNLHQQDFTDGVAISSAGSTCFAQFVHSDDPQPARDHFKVDEMRFLVSAAWHRYADYLLTHGHQTMIRIADIVSKTSAKDWSVRADYQGKRLGVHALVNGPTGCNVDLATRGAIDNTVILLQQNSKGEYFSIVATLLPGTDLPPGVVHLWQDAAPEMEQDLFLKAKEIVIDGYLTALQPEGPMN